MSTLVSQFSGVSRTDGISVGIGYNARGLRDTIVVTDTQPIHGATAAIGADCAAHAGPANARPGKAHAQHAVK